MIKVIGIAGSPRKQGNSSTLMQAALAGAAEAGAAVEEVYLNDMMFHGCQACQPCTEDATCRIDDALTPVLEKVRQADVWVLASPVYFDGASGQFKLFFDRLVHLVTDSTQSVKQLKGPRGAAIFLTYEDKSRADYRRVANVFANYLGWMGDFGEVEVMTEGSLGPSQPVQDRPELLAAAREIGTKLVGRLTSG